jgi:hypothetical protein
MGNRACNGVLCYDIDPERSVQEETASNDIAVIYSKNLPSRFKRALSNSYYATDSFVVPPNNKRRPSSRRGGGGGEVKHQVTNGTATIPFGRANSNSRRKNVDKQQHTTSYSDLSAGTSDNIVVSSSIENPTSTAPQLPPYNHCRTMSSETCGREARTEVNLSRRSSTTTCEREGMYDDILFHRSHTLSEERS